MILLRLQALAALMLVYGCAIRHPGPSPLLKGPGRSELPVYRNERIPDKIYVVATLPDGIDRVFLVDTGSSLSTVSREVALALGLQPSRRSGRLVGLGGSIAWHGATLESLKIGDYTLREIDVAIGVAGLPTRVGLVPLAGIIGNNVWSQFQLSIDYPANTMVLARGEMALPQSAQPMFFNGQHPLTRATIHAAAAAATVQHPLLLEIDTGARGLLLMGPTPAPLEALASEGEEPIMGIGSPDDLPPSTFLRRTRRIALRAVQVGGVTLEEELNATWIDYDKPRHHGQIRVSGLLGHEVLDQHRVILDYLGSQFAMVPSTGTATKRPIHEWYLKQSQRRSGSDGRLETVRILLWLGRSEKARAALARLVARRNADPAAVVLQARLQRSDGDSKAAHSLLEPLTIQNLIDEHELLAWCNSLWLSGDVERALTVTEKATGIAPGNPQVWVARADVLRAADRRTEARNALKRANQLDENPDGHLLRRAWLAVEDGDHHAALTHLRRLLDLYPSSGIVQLLYAKQAKDPRTLELIRQDLARAQARLHQGDGPLDFMAAAWQEVGDVDRAQKLKDAGLRRDCAHATSPQSKDNCQAWYQALVHQELDDARTRIDRALEKAPRRAEFLDTLAMVLEAQGHLQQARDAALKAAQLAPDDVYLLVQAARLTSAAASP